MLHKCNVMSILCRYTLQEKLIQDVRQQDSVFWEEKGGEIGMGHKESFWDASNFLSIDKFTFWKMCRYL